LIVSSIYSWRTALKTARKYLVDLSSQAKLSANEEVDNCNALFYSELPTLPQKSYSLNIQTKYKHGKLGMAAALCNTVRSLDEETAF
jgi:hypothetical protein